MSDNDSITLSPKHGVNPAMDTCFWCGEPKGIAFLGLLKDDAKAPRNIITSYEPCDKCKAKFDMGIHVIGVSTTPSMEGMQSIGNDSNGSSLYPDGSYFIASEDYIRRIYKDNEKAVEHVLETRKLLMPADFVRKIIEYNNQEVSNNEDCECGVSGSDSPESD